MRGRVVPGIVGLVVGCGAPGSAVRGPEAPDDTGVVATPPPVAVVGPDHLALPFAAVGDPSPAALLPVDGAASIDAVTGPFAAAREGDAVRVTYTGDMAVPALAVGAVSLQVDGQPSEVTLAAVVGAAGLPVADWVTDAWGTSATVRLDTAAFPANSGETWADGRVLVSVPPGVSTVGGVGFVTHFHGWYADLDSTVPRQHLVEQHLLGGRDAVLVVPQGPLSAASSDFGQLAEPGGHAALLRDVLSVLYRDGLLADARVGPSALTAHSGGYVATARVLEAADGPVAAVHLFDGLYGELDAYEAFARGGGVLRSSHTPFGGTGDTNDLLADRLAGAVPLGTAFDDDALDADAVTIGPSPSDHDGEVWYRRNAARWLASSGLPPRPSAPPELRWVGPDEVVWRIDAGAPARQVRVEGSVDGRSWSTLGEGTAGRWVGATAPFVRLVGLTGAVASAPSDVYGSTGAGWWVVDGFDRVLDGSYRLPTHAFAAQVAAALPVPASVASNEAVAAGEVDLTTAPGIVWLLGDEGTMDGTFDPAEAAALAAAVAAGVPVVVSGSEVGYATDPAFLSDVLGAVYLADDAGTDRAGGFTFGVAYPEDYPDVLGGGPALWTYDTGGAAAVQTAAGVIVGFPLETLAPADLAPALAALVAAVGG